MSDTDPTGTLSQLSTSLIALETALEPLLSKPFDQLLEQSENEPLVQARMQVLASYVVHDLIWVYLKTAGVEPSTHPVMEEIERLKSYFGKLKQAERGAPPAAQHSTARPQLDKAAANRFINAAIASGKARVDPSYTPGEGDEDAQAGPSGTHIRFEDAEVDRLLEDKDEEEESEDEKIEVEEGDSAGAEEENAKGKGKETSAKAGKEEKKRAAFDPFAGYDQHKPSTPAASSKKAKFTKSATAVSSASSPATATPQSSSSKRRRAQTDPNNAIDASATAESPVGGNAGKKGSGEKKKKLKMKVTSAK
ncbi:hypothetical protein JCM11641_001074 [Rhodosporidiobolus odoratus]